jgi:hypothetical protein
MAELARRRLRVEHECGIVRSPPSRYTEIMAEDPPDEAYEMPEISADDIAVDTQSDWQGVAIYTLELPAKCPACREPIRTLRVLKLSRTQVSFTSTFPRTGRAFVCPNCERILSVELSGIM